MDSKRFIILFLIFISTSVITISSAQTDTIAKPDTILKIKDSTYTTIISQPNILAEVKDSIQKEPFIFSIGKSILNKSFWAQPYRYEDKENKTLSVRVVVQNVSDKRETVNFNLLSLLIDDKKLRIRPTGIYYYRNEKKVYLKSKPLNKNYNDFEEHAINGYQNSEAKTYKVNFLGLKKKKGLPTVKTLKKIVVKNKKISYYIDFPVQEGFAYGKIYYKDKPVGFAAIKN